MKKILSILLTLIFAFSLIITTQSVEAKTRVKSYYRKMVRTYNRTIEAAYQIMRNLSFGITNSDLSKIPEGNLQ